MEPTIQIIIYSLVVLSFIFSTFLSVLNYRNRNAFIPEEVQDVYDAEKYIKWKEYYMEQYKFGRVTSVINFIVFILLLSLGGFAYIETISVSMTSNPYLQVLFFLAIYYLLSSVISLYPDYYATFVIEEKYGFNKSTKKTFVIDKIKSLLLVFVLGGSLIFGLINLFENTGNMFFLYAWLCLSLIIVVSNLIYVPVIVPIFNKLTDLEDGTLKDKINEFAKGVGYEVSKISIMDASKRSTKLNAFFAGLGHFKKVVLYDTLVAEMSEDEIVAVLAHEIGHSKHKHIFFNLGQTIMMLLLYVGVLGLVLKVPEFSTAFGFSGAHFGFSLVLFTVLLEPISILLGLVSSYFSRKYEYQADNFASVKFSAEEMEKALKVLARANFSNLTPHPLIVKLTYSHPPIAERIREIRKAVDLNETK